jgi:hypothetical protein
MTSEPQIILYLAVRRRWFESRSGHVEFVVEKAALRQIFSEYFGFPCQIFHRPLHTQHHPPSGAGTIGQILVDVPSGLSLNRFWGYVSVCVQLYCRCFTVLHLVVAVLHYMLRPTWPSSSLYDLFIYFYYQSELSTFYELICWLRHCHRVLIMSWWGPLQWGDLFNHQLGLLARIFLTFFCVGARVGAMW